jgi:hypothetical protein
MNLKELTDLAKHADVPLHRYIVLGIMGVSGG